MINKIRKNIRKYLIGATVSIGIGSGALVFTNTADGCQVEYKQTENINHIL